MHLHTNDGGGIVEAARTDFDQRFLLTAAKAGALASLMGENETAAFMQMTKNGGSFGIEKGNHMQGFVGVAEDGESGTIMLTNADNTNSVNLAASKQGGRIILGSDDGTARASLFATEVGASSAYLAISASSAPPSGPKRIAGHFICVSEESSALSPRPARVVVLS